MAPKQTQDPGATRTAPVSSDADFDLMDWIQVNSRWLGATAAVIAVAAAGYWFYIRSQQIKTVNAKRSLLRAEQSLQSGNAALATSDLQRVVSRYKGTVGATRAGCSFGRAVMAAESTKAGFRVA